MDEHNLQEHLSFKSQMAARYRERLSMGFPLGPSYFEAQQDRAQQASIEEGDRSCMSRETHDTEEIQPRSRRALPTWSRSRSSLGEHLADSGKPSMKELITKFERRSSTSSQLRTINEVDGGKRRMARDAWESTYPRVKMELDPSAATSSSSSYTIGSKSLTSLSKTAFAKTSRATLSLNNDAIKQQMLQSTNLRFSHKHKGGEKLKLYTNEIEFNSPNSNQFNKADVPETKVKKASEPIRSPLSLKMNEATSIISNSGQHNLNLKSDTQEVRRKSSAESDQVQPLRVSLRGIAARKKLKAEKYIVHRKDWGKQHQANQQAPGGASLVETEQSFQSSRAKSAPDTTTKAHHRKSRRDDTSVQILLAEAGAESANRRRKSEKRGGLRVASRSEMQVTEEKPKTSAISRYKQFLMTNHPDQPEASISAMKMVEKLRQASRPPTLVRLANARKNGDAPNNMKESSIAKGGGYIPSFTDARYQSRRLEKESRAALLTHYKQKVRAASTGKEVSGDLSAGELIGSSAVTTPNSIDSSLHVGKKKQAILNQIGQRKPEIVASKMTKAASLPKTLGRLEQSSSKVPQILRDYNNSPVFAEHRGTSAAKKIMYGDDPKVGELVKRRSSSLIKSSEHDFTKINTDLIKSHRNTVFGNPGSTEAVARSDSLQGQAGSEKTKSGPNEPADFWSQILTADELADNDLVPRHLRDRKIRGASPVRTAKHFSSSDDSNSISVGLLARNARMLPLAKTSNMLFGEIPTENSTLIDTIEAQYMARNKKSKSGKDLQSKGKTQSPIGNANVPAFSRRILEGNRQPGTNDKARVVPPGQAPTLSGSECVYSRDSANLLRVPSVQQNAAEEAKNKIPEKNARAMKKAPRSRSTAPDASSSQPNAGVFNPLSVYATPEKEETPLLYAHQGDHVDYLQKNDRRGASTLLCSLRSPIGTTKAEKSSSHAGTELRSLQKGGRSRDSPAKPSLDHKVPSAGRERKEPASRVNSTLQRTPSLQNKDSITSGNVVVPEPPIIAAHFGQNLSSTLSTSADKDGEFSSPPKKKTKTDKTKKTKKKKKKKTKDTEEPDVLETMGGPQIVTKPSKEKKIPKEKIKENSIEREVSSELTGKSRSREKHSKKQEKHREAMMAGKTARPPEKPETRDNTEVRNKISISAQKPEKAERGDSAETLSQRKKDLKIVETSPPAASPNKCSSVDRWFSMSCDTKDPKPANQKKMSSTRLPVIYSVPRLPFQPSERYPLWSRIPQLMTAPSKPRKKIDKLIRYRRWCEAVLDPLHPIKLPLSKSFRETLNSSVLEEWAMHCWLPNDVSRESFWSASYEDVTEADVNERLLRESGMFTKEGFLDRASRLPYWRWGFLRFHHITYVMTSFVFAFLSYMGLKMYNCDGNDYEYFCTGDYVDCLAPDRK